MAHTAELTEELDAARVRSQESLRSLGQMEQLEAELEGAVVAHGAAIDRVRVLDEERELLQEQLDELRAAPNDLDQEVTKLRIELATSTRGTRRAGPGSAKLSELVEAANAKTASNDKVRELERLLDIAEAEHDSLMQEVSDLRVELAERTAPAVDGARRRRRTTRRSRDARAARDAFAKQVQELERSLASSSERRDVALHQVGELERALSQEQLRVREAEEELRRLHSTASVDVHAGRDRARRTRTRRGAAAAGRRADTSANAARPGGGAGAGRGGRAGVEAQPARSRSRPRRRRSSAARRWPSSPASRRSKNTAADRRRLPSSRNRFAGAGSGL